MQAQKLRVEEYRKEKEERRKEQASPHAEKEIKRTELEEARKSRQNEQKPSLGVLRIPNKEDFARRNLLRECRSSSYASIKKNCVSCSSNNDYYKIASQIVVWPPEVSQTMQSPPEKAEGSKTARPSPQIIEERPTGNAQRKRCASPPAPKRMSALMVKDRNKHAVEVYFREIIRRPVHLAKPKPLRIGKSPTPKTAEQRKALGESAYETILTMGNNGEVLIHRKKERSQPVPKTSTQN